MSESSSSSECCPKCGAALSSAATAGLCPRCLMAEAMVPTRTGAEPAGTREMLSLEELAPHFPQLEILECLGRGGMGVVYKARQKSLNRFVALKLLAPERVNDAGFAERFQREAQALAALGHPHIVTVHDFGQAGGFYFLLMEYVDGVSLRQAMKTGRFTPEQALAIVPPVCEALQYAHEHGIVHRDIKPENLLLDKEGRVKIADFGIAKMVGSELGTPARQGEAKAEQPAEAPASLSAGTPQYMAPEQKEHRRTDHRADIYSLGVVLYEMLTGELPAAKLQPPSRKVQIDVRLDEIVLRALEVKPERRYQSAGELKTMVESVATVPDPSAALRAHWEERAPGWRIRCLKCGFTEPWGKYGISLFAAARRKYTLGYCQHCHWIRFHAIEKSSPTVPVPPTEGRDARATQTPRFSRKAIVGACWVLFFGIAIGTTFVYQPAGTGHDTEFALILTLLLLAFVAPFVTTLLGWLAVAQIRSSAGRICGLGLALFDGLFFPLVAVLMVTGSFWFWLFFDVVRNIPVRGSGGPMPPEVPLPQQIVIDHPGGLTVLAAFLTSSIAGFFIVRRVWWWANTPSVNSSASTRESVSSRKASVAMVLLGVGGILGGIGLYQAASSSAIGLFILLMSLLAIPLRKTLVGKCLLVLGGCTASIWLTAAAGSIQGTRFNRWRSWQTLETLNCFTQSLDEQLRIIEQSMGLDSSNKDAYRLWAEKLMEKKDYPRAAGAWHYLTQIDKTNFGKMAIAIEGIAHLFAGKPVQAAGCLEEAVRLFPERLTDRVFLAAAYADLGLREKVKIELVMLAKLNPRWQAEFEFPLGGEAERQTVLAKLEPYLNAPLTKTVMATGSLDATTDIPARWICKALVNEVDIVAVEIGQEVRLTVDAIPKQKFQGKVAKIGNKPVAMPNVVLYETIIDIANPDQTFKAGMSANVEFIVAQREGQAPSAPPLRGDTILARDVRLHFADPTEPDGSFHSRQSVGFAVVFVPIKDVPLLLTVLTVGPNVLGMSLGRDLLEISEGERGGKIASFPWPATVERFEKVVSLPVQFGDKQYSCPVHFELQRRKDGPPSGRYWYCAYLSGKFPAAAGDRAFEIVNLHPEMKFRNSPIGGGIEDAVLGLDLDGDGKIGENEKVAELYAPFPLGSKRYRLTEIDPAKLRVAFREVAE